MSSLVYNNYDEFSYVYNKYDEFPYGCQVELILYEIRVLLISSFINRLQCSRIPSCVPWYKGKSLLLPTGI